MPDKTFRLLYGKSMPQYSRPEAVFPETSKELTIATIFPLCPLLVDHDTQNIGISYEFSLVQ